MEESSAILRELGVVSPGFIGPTKAQLVEATRGNKELAQRLGLL
jgi:hypothetical protein